MREADDRVEAFMKKFWLAAAAALILAALLPDGAFAHRGGFRGGGFGGAGSAMGGRFPGAALGGGFRGAAMGGGCGGAARGGGGGPTGGTSPGLRTPPVGPE